MTVEKNSAVDFSMLTQYQYNHLLSVLAQSLHTQRKFILLFSGITNANGETTYRVKKCGYWYRVTLNGYKLIAVAREV